MIVLCFFGRLRIVFDEPGEVLGVVDFVAEHLFAAGGVRYQLVSFFSCDTSYFYKKRYKLEVDSVRKNKKG